MRKKVIFLILFIVSIFIPLVFVKSNLQVNDIEALNKPSDLFQNLSPEYVPLDDKGIWAINLSSYSNSITLDGNLTDWDGIPKEKFDDFEIYLAFDSNYVYIAVQWEDSTLDKEVSKWNKTGMIDEDDAQWEYIGGKDDQLKIGFQRGDESDFWVWTSSNITIDPYVYEYDGNNSADNGILPFVMNTNGTNFEGNVKPIYDNNHIPITDWEVFPVSTYIDAYFPNASTSSQTDVIVATDWNNTKKDHYTLEFKRALNTSQSDDMIFDFGLNDFYFFIGRIDGETTEYFWIDTEDYRISIENEAPILTFDIIPGLVTSSLLIGGTVYDDYENYDFTVYLTDWYNMTGPYLIDYIEVNPFTGQWQYLFLYNQYNMPLGEQTVIIEFRAKYDETITMKQNTTFEDIEEPEILGLVDLHERYPLGVPIETEYVVVTVAVRDNYIITDDLHLQLYCWVDEGVALMTPMIQYAPGGTTFSANIILSYNPNAENNYSYFVQAWDLEHNKATSEYYSFIVVDEPLSTPSPPPMTAPTATIELGIQFVEVIIIGSIALSLIVSSILKKIKLER